MTPSATPKNTNWISAQLNRILVGLKLLFKFPFILWNTVLTPLDRQSIQGCVCSAVAWVLYANLTKEMSGLYVYLIYAVLECFLAKEQFSMFAVFGVACQWHVLTFVPYICHIAPIPPIGVMLWAQVRHSRKLHSTVTNIARQSNLSKVLAADAQQPLWFPPCDNRTTVMPNTPRPVPAEWPHIVSTDPHQPPPMETLQLEPTTVNAVSGGYASGLETSLRSRSMRIP